MNPAELMKTAEALVAEHRGLLAMDESTPTCNKRFAAAGIPATESARRDYRELIVTTPGLAESVSGAILYDETLRQHTRDGRRMIDVLRDAGIIPGVKVDRGAQPLAGFPGEKITEGLDGLRARLTEYRELGAKFTKWRAVIGIGLGRPSLAAVRANAQALARYAALAQELDLVPIVEPEVLMDGSHGIERCFEVTQEALHALFAALYEQRVMLSGTLLKPNMVVPGSEAAEPVTPQEVAALTVSCLASTVPPAVPGIAFLSGGQSGPDACARLQAINVHFGTQAPWALTYSFSRAIQYPALEIWAGRADRVAAAQQALRHRAACSHAARRARYTPGMEEKGGPAEPAGA